MVAKNGQKCYYCYLKVKKAVEVVLPLKQGLKPKINDDPEFDLKDSG